MGPRNNRAAVASASSSVGKDREIELLKSKLEAYEILTAQLKTRLLYTQDALQSIHTTHLQELAAEKETNERLQLRYDRSKQVVRSLRKERDDLQEAFDVLLQKVEVCNNYTSWPFPRIHMANGAAPASPFDPVDTTFQQRTPGIQQNPEAAYNSSVIATLRRERDEARTERDLVVNESVAKLSMLEAQLALRDSEIEELVQYPGSHQGEARPGDTPRLSGEDALRIFRYNTAKNLTVEKEVNRLRKRLETPLGDHGTPSSQRSRADASTQIPKASPSMTPKVIDEFDREVQDLASKLEAFRLEKAKLLDLISASKRETKQAATSEALGTSPAPSTSEPTPTREELQAAYSESLQRAEMLTRENERLKQLLGAKDVSDKATQTLPEEVIPDIPVPSEDDGEQSMEMATPLFPSTIVLRPLSSSSRTTSISRSRSTSTRASPRSRTHSSSSPDVEVDPSSIMLPPSPLIEFDLEEGSQPFQSTPPPFIAPRPPTQQSGYLNLDWERGPTPSPDVLDPDKTIGLNLGSSSSPIPGPSTQPSASPFIRNASPGEQVARLEAELTEAERKLKVGEEAVDELKGLIEDLMRFSPS